MKILLKSSWLLAALKGETVSDDIKNMLARAFKTAGGTGTNIQPAGGLNITVSPQTITEGLVSLQVELTPPRSAAIQITIKNLASGAETASRAVLDDYGKFNSPILNISVGNKDAWAGENSVTVETEPSADEQSEILSGAGTFKVIDYKMTVTVEPEIVTANSELKIKVEISPPVEADLTVECADPLIKPDVPLKTDVNGRKELSVFVKPPDPNEWPYVSRRNIDVFVSVPVGDDSITLWEFGSFYLVYPELDFNLNIISPDIVDAGDIVNVKIHWPLFDSLKAGVQVVIRNESGYSQSFKAAVGAEGSEDVILPILEITPFNKEQWAGMNEVTVILSVPSGEKTLTAEMKGLFFVREPVN